ncbi:SMC family ATPase [Sporolactobacillus shoreicorticis]|uniref:Nuclease SbcCD subunit C n=1 Tax=Sporolactobacillus shoreicorticis TaxID=1923877 RepID=A0ABW5S702_9BACL|nr:SMC family ATPase [Sporolactobacillus shoreicorticis]MCO7126702.1 SMC family ATPase [Sporolactobacillus shoreicorticis]
MKPIELTLNGLNSFREEQHIDFEALCADGLFGIFGPTGSGKSTILDGITLALYGTVERAANNTSGILNQLEQQMSVGFTFELSGDETEQYRAERSYKRTKDGGLRLASCRLLKLGAVNEVIADKERDLTRSVQEILGLTHDDFTRAVVLPQGKFAEFLTLKGNDRRKMLQRLFHLERYGDELSARLKRAFDERKQWLQIVSEKQAMLGDASEEAVHAAIKRCTEIERKLTLSRTNLEKVEAEKHLFEQIRSMIEDKKAKAQALQKLMQEKDKYAAIKIKLSRSEAADKLMPYLDALRDAELDTTKARDEHAEARRRFEHAKAQFEAAKKKREDRKKNSEEKMPSLDERRQKFLQGASIQSQLKSEWNALRELQSAKNNLEQSRDKARTALAQEQQRLNELKKNVQIKESELATLEVSSDRRALIQQALQEKKEIDSLDGYLGEKRGEWLQLRDALEKCKQEINRLENEQTQINKKDLLLFKQNQEIYNRTVDTIRLIRSAQAFVDVQNKKVEQERERINRHNLSLQLVAALREGEPCPVCGSLHHPSPEAGDMLLSDAEIDAKKNFYQKTTEFLINQLQETRICAAQLEQQAKAFSDSVQAAVPSGHEIHDASLSIDFAEWGRLGIKELLNQIMLAVKEEEQDQLHVADQLVTQLERARMIESQRSKCDTQAAMYKEKMTALKKQAIEKKQERDVQLKEWNARFSSFDKVQEQASAIRGADQKAEHLHVEVQQMKKALSQLEQKVDQDQEIVRGLDEQRSEWVGRQEASKKSLHQWREQLHALELSEDMPLNQLALDSEKEMSRLKQEMESAEHMAQTAMETYHRMDKECANASAREDRAVKTHQSASAKWEERLAASQFDQRDHVQRAHLNDDERVRLSEDLTSYEEQTTKLSSEIQSISEKLGNQSVSKAQLDELRQQWVELKEKVQSLIKSVGAATKERENLEKNHKLFLKLESERKKNQKASDQYEKLQRVFRGNAFVEFVAEEQLQQVCAAASKRLGELTHNRYVLEVDEEGGFIIRDNGNGGVYRPVASLSGGETFLTSLALALSLSEQIQLRGNVPLQFFFLDEGFGSLDPDLLDTVVTALEKLHMRRLAIGIISHVPEMRERLPRRLIVSPAIPSGRGSRVHMEMI